MTRSWCSVLLSLSVLGGLSFIPACGGEDSAATPPESAGQSGAAGNAGLSGNAGQSGAAGTAEAGAAGDAGGGGTAGVGAGASGTGGAGGQTGEAPVITEVNWAPCDLLLDYPPNSESKTFAGECATVTAPLIYGQAGATLSLKVKRRAAIQQPARAQLWLLNGGPGSSSQELEPLLFELSQKDPGLDVYTLDFRGTGESTRLTCPAEEFGGLQPSEVSKCVNKMATKVGSLDGFTTSHGARDVASLLASTRAPGQRSFVFGFSYGTFWVHRFLQMFPSLADGAVLDSIATPTADFSVYSVDADEVAQQFFALCGQDTGCAERLSTEPWSKVQEFFAKPPNEVCPAAQVLPQEVWKQVLARMLRKVTIRPLLPALVHRLLRCDPGDELAIEHLIGALKGIPEEPPEAFTLPLYEHVVFSELWTTTPQSAEAYDAIDTKLLVAPLGTGDQQRLWDVWPRTARDEWAGQTAQTPVPLLLLQGGLDPQTPQKRVDPFAASFQGAHQRYITFPLAPHGVSFQTPLASDPSQSCGLSLLMQFVADPEAELDLSCQQEQAPLDFGDQSELSTLLFGQPSMWESSAPPLPPTPKPSLQTQRAALELQQALRAPR